MSFEHDVEIILKREGGYVNNPKDPGGETKYGISKRSYPELDIKNIDRSQAIAIYRKDYWNACRCEELPVGVALMVFDTAVNQGMGTARRALQEALGVPVDGIIGQQTINAAIKADAGEVIEKLYHIRYKRYLSDANFSIFGEGWINRLNAIHAEAEESI